MPNTKISNLVANSSPTGDDLLVTVDDVAGTPVSKKTTIDQLDTYLAQTTQTLTNKTLTSPVISSISNSGTVTIPTGTRTLVARDTTDTLTNKTLTSPVLNNGISGSALLGNTSKIVCASASGTSGNVVKWDANGNAADASIAVSDVLLNSTRENSKTFTIENPTSSEDYGGVYFKNAATITKMVAVLQGSSSPSVTWTIRHGSDRSAAGTEVVTSGTTTTSVSTGSVITSFNSASITAGDFVWLKTTAKSGTVTGMHVTFVFTGGA